MTDVNIGELCNRQFACNRSGKLSDNITNHKRAQEDADARKRQGRRRRSRHRAGNRVRKTAIVAWARVGQIDTTPQQFADASTWDWKNLVGSISCLASKR